MWDQKNYTIRKLIYDFLFDFYGDHFSISYRSRDNASQNFEGRTKWQILTFWRSRINFQSTIEKAPTLTKRHRLRYCTWKSVQPFRMYPCQIFPILLDYLGRWHDVNVQDTIFGLSPTKESCNWIDFISVAYASWYHWNCGLIQHKAATINQLACLSYSFYLAALVPNVLPRRDEGSGKPCEVIEAS